MSLRKSNTARAIEIARKNKRLSVMDSLFVLCFLHLAQCFAKLVGTRSRSVTTTDTFQSFNDIFHFHSLHQSPDSLKVSVTSSPEKDFRNDSVFHLEFDVAAASALRLISQLLYHYSSSVAGFMLVKTVCTSSNSSNLSIIFSMVSRCSGVTSLVSFGM